MSSSGCNYCSYAMRPLVYRTVDELLTEFRPAADDDLLKMVKILDFVAINELLQISPNRVVHGIEIRTIWRPVLRFDEFQPSSVLRIRIKTLSSSVSGAMFYYNNNI